MGWVETFVNGGAPGISADILNEPFHIRSATYQASPSQINVVMGPGRVDFGLPGDNSSHIVTKTTTTAVTISSPTISTTYNVFLQAAGTFRTSTSSILLGNEVRCGTVATGGTLSSITITDQRSMMPVPAPRALRQGMGSGTTAWSVEGTGSVSGYDPGSVSDYFWQAGTWSGTYTAGVNGKYVAFPQAFPNALCSVVVVNGDNALTAAHAIVVNAGTGLAGVQFVLVNPGGGEPSGVCRMNYIAMGF